MQGQPSGGGIGIIISGRGSNMNALAEACRDGRVPAEVRLVVSNDPGAQGLRRAADLGIRTAVIAIRRGRSREEHDAEMAGALEEAGASLICLAGYMRLLSASFVRKFPSRIMNIHPALLPAFPGLHAQRQALESGVKYSGATVHFVDEGLDTGPIILQSVVPVLQDDTEESLSERILKEEHKLYPEAARLFFEQRLRIEGRRVRITG